MSRVVQYLKMAMDRMNGIIMSIVYSGITMFRGMVNAIQFIIKIILFICVLMLIIIIILFFILFPVMPIIMTTLGAIIITVVAMASVMSGSLAADAEDKKKGFCFSGETLLSVWREEVVQHVPIKDVRVGDELQGGTGRTRVTAVIHMDGEGVELYDLLGVTISESHLVKGTDGVWKSVGEDERAIKTEKRERILYCLNTANRIIPVRASDGSILSFRDWEEIEDDDEVGQYGWNELVLSQLNGQDSQSQWKRTARMPTDIPLVSPERLVKTRMGFIPVSAFTTPQGDQRVSFGWVLDRHGKEQRVLGWIRGEVEEYELDGNPMWNTELYEEHDGVWIKGTTTGLKLTTGHKGLQGIHLITETGEWILWDEGEKKEKIIRDFTEVGYDSIHHTYPFVSSRLRPADNLQDPK
jgi:hypothetical protein